MAPITHHVRTVRKTGAPLRNQRAPQTQRRVAEFFSGIGLVRLAFERRGWNIVFANDIDPAKAAMYRHNWPDEDHLLVKDVHEIEVGQLPDAEVFTASFPCNDLSVAGRQEGLNGRQSSAFWGLIRLLRETNSRRPALVLLENVVGFLTSNEGRDFEDALLALNDLGYAVDAMLLNAVHWTPQSRPRLFVVAARTDDTGATFASESTTRPLALTQFINLHQNVRWRIRTLPAPPPPRHRLESIVEDLPEDDPHWWSEPRVEYFMNQLSDRHARQAEKMIGSDVIQYATAFRRVRYGRSMAELRTDGLAGCLRTPRGGSGRQILFKAGRGRRQVRLLTARECARLQGVPESFRIEARLNQALFGFGDAVCVPVVEWMIDHHIEPTLAELLKYDRRRPSRLG